MQKKDVLRKLDLGNSVAEFDAALEDYFVETETFRKLIRDEGDIVAGDKGTGKTALYRILTARYTTIDELAQVEVIPGFNPSGNPVFQELVHSEPLDEGQYITIWKAYILSLVGNWVLGIYNGAYTERMPELERMLEQANLRTTDDAPRTVFTRLARLYRRLTDPDAAEVEVALSEEGIPVMRTRVEFGGGTEAETRKVIPHRDALELLDDVLENSEISAWIVLDRLDEAFVGYPDVEIPALRALLRTFLDLVEFGNIRLKLFLRKDLFQRITASGFVNLTHVYARKFEITWDEDDLLDLLVRRICRNRELLNDIEVEPQACSNEEIYNRIFPDQVDPGERRPTTWRWMMTRIRDGNDVKPPRNLIDLVIRARDAQLRREEREEHEFLAGDPVIESDAIKKGLAALSEARVVDTLLAEAGEYAIFIERFRDGKAEHNLESLQRILGLTGSDLEDAIKGIVEIGFLGQVGENYKVPMLYRDGLGITQGKAF